MDRHPPVDLLTESKIRLEERLSAGKTINELSVRMDLLGRRDQREIQFWRVLAGAGWAFAVGHSIYLLLTKST